MLVKKEVSHEKESTEDSLDAETGSHDRTGSRHESFFVAGPGWSSSEFGVHRKEY
jgi:hypothetical protein